MRFIYSSSVRKEVLSFHRPGPLGFSVRPKRRLIIEWSVLYTVTVSELFTLPNRWRLKSQKSSRKDLVGLRLLHVNVFSNGFWSGQISPRSRLICTFFYIRERFCVQGPGNELFSREHVIQNRESTSLVSAVSPVFIPPHLHLQHMRMAAHLPALEFFIACQ